MIPGGAEDQVWVIVERTINSATKRYVEQLDPQYWATHAAAFYVHSGITVASHGGGAVSGLTHLEAETVSIMADGVTQPTQVVASGQITHAAATTLNIGLKYTATMAPMPYVNPQTGGTWLYRVRKAVAKFYQTLSFKAGPNETDLEERTLEVAGVAVTAPTDAIEDVPLDSGYEKDGRLYFVNDEPQPFGILRIEPEIEAERQ